MLLFKYIYLNVKLDFQSWKIFKFFKILRAKGYPSKRFKSLFTDVSTP